MRSAGQEVSARLGGHVSSSTLSARQMARAGEPVDSDGSIVWVKMHVGETDQTYNWNRRTCETIWRAAAGVEVVWMGGRSDGGMVWYSLRCLLGDGLRSEGLGIPSPLLLCHSSCLKQEWFWRVRSSSWCFSSRATWSVVGFFWLLGASMVPASSGLQIVLRRGESLDSSGCCVANGCF